MSTAFELHVERWKNCTRCTYSQRRSNVVFVRGKLPCSVLLVGEAPGTSENTLGYPFAGKSGRVLDEIITRSLPQELPYALTNVLGCIPYDDDKQKESDPDHECIMSCKPKLEELIGIANPSLIVAVGKLSEEWLDQGYKHSVKLPRPIPMVSIQHPSSILRSPLMMQGLAKQKCVVTITTALRQHLLVLE